jgi:hypothetical protein
LVPGRPEIVALVDWAVQHELASTVSDVMTRRTQLYFRDVDQGLGVVDAVSGRMQQLLGWSDDEREFFCEDYRAEVGLARAWKDGYDAAVAANAAASEAPATAPEAADEPAPAASAEAL